MDWLKRITMAAAGLALAAVLAAGCTAKPNVTVVETFDTGQFGAARVALYEKLPERPSRGNVDRNYLLHYLRVAVLTLADGYPEAAGPLFEEVYDLLRMQGLNEDRTVQSVLVNEDLKIWKGEPFEQALAYIYIAAQLATVGSWDNTRAVASNALFHLRDFGVDDKGNPLDTEAIVKRAAEAGDKGDEMLDTGYVVRQSDFVMAHLLIAVANRQLGRLDEANANFNHALALDAGLEPLIERLRGGDYNTLLMVSYGRGPVKTGTGPDKAISKFVPAVRSDSGGLSVFVDGTRQRFPVASDINRMAQDHRWNNLEDMRIAKSHVGTALVAGGATMALASRDQNVQIVGLGVMAIGAIAKAGAHADTRYCEAMPQRLYLAPLTLGEGQRASIALDSNPAARLTLAGLKPPPPGQTQFRYVRLIGSGAAQVWTTSPQPLYCTPYEDGTGGAPLPYILGGYCVRPPSVDTLRGYQAAGFLADMSLGDLEELYRSEGIQWRASPNEYPGLHVLEGGNSLIAPLPGTAGYARLFCQPHRPYAPRSPEVRQVAQQVQQQIAAQRAAAGANAHQALR